MEDLDFESEKQRHKELHDEISAILEYDGKIPVAIVNKLAEQDVLKHDAKIDTLRGRNDTSYT